MSDSGESISLSPSHFPTLYLTINLSRSLCDSTLFSLSVCASLTSVALSFFRPHQEAEDERDHVLVALRGTRGSKPEEPQAKTPLHDASTSAKADAKPTRNQSAAHAATTLSHRSAAGARHPPVISPTLSDDVAQRNMPLPRIAESAARSVSVSPLTSESGEGGRRSAVAVRAASTRQADPLAGGSLGTTDYICGALSLFSLSLSLLSLILVSFSFV